MKYKRIMATCLLFFVALVVIPTPARAATIEEGKCKSIFLQTDNPEIGVEIYISDTSSIEPMSYNTKSAWYSGRFYHIDTDETIADLKLTAEFSYDGTICNVLSVSATASGVERGYTVEKNPGTEQISPTYAKAYCYFELYKTGFFGNSLSSACTVIIYCNQSGTITNEWNG